MTQETTINPFLLWKSMYDTTETVLSKAIDEVLRKEEYAELLGNIQSGYLQYQELIQKTTDTYLSQMNIPTREEISNVASLIINLEEKVEDLYEKVEEEQLNQSVTAEIKKLKTNMTKLDRKLNQILQLLKSNDDPAAETTTDYKK